MRERLAFPPDATSGAAATAVVYFEVEPGHHCGAHSQSAEEVLLVLEGEAVVGEERGRFRAGGVALAPADAPHDLRNLGEGTLRVVGFFPSAAVVTVFEEKVLPPETARSSWAPRKICSPWRR